MTDWIIEDGVEIPVEKRGRVNPVGVGRMSPLGEAVKNMKVGQSLFTDKYPPNMIRGLVHSRKRRNPENYVTREMDGGIRVWRVE